MLINFNKFKILKKFNIYTLYEFTTKINIYYNTYNNYKLYKLPKQINILRILYKLNKKKIKYYLSKFTITKLIYLLKILKSRLDFILFNSNFFLTLNHARQNILHKHILVDNKIIINYSYMIKNNNIIYIYNRYINLLKNILIYNYIIRNIYINIIESKINKIISLINFKYSIKVIKSFNILLFDSTICYKTFKIKINNNYNINTLICDNILNLY
uniref:Ribosomal protein S4 n=1 Tax=Babesia duncani TaxID=323732 RepID=A0A385GNJ1_9APIC|nr:ribosomal protein S4 [Babesia duncani]